MQHLSPCQASCASTGRLLGQVLSTPWQQEQAGRGRGGKRERYRRQEREGKVGQKWDREESGEGWVGIQTREMDGLNILLVQGHFLVNSSRLRHTPHTVHLYFSLGSKQSQTLRVGGVEVKAILRAECSTSAWIPLVSVSSLSGEAAYSIAGQCSLGWTSLG